ncbi:LacI family DNA-binding transcriptional regulator [Oscillibacter ruminantium]
MVTIKDISKACGVSHSTVSKVLNGYPDVSEETVALVRRTAEEMGYTPNAAARLLKTNRSHNIGVLFVDQLQSGLRHDYFSAVLNDFKNEAECGGYDLTFISQNLGGSSMSYLEHCRYRNCDGVIIACVDFEDPAVRELVGSDIPVVTVDHVFDQRGAVVSDNVKGMQDLVTHVYEKGHRRIAYIHGEMTSVTRSRLASFCHTCEELGAEVPEAYIRPARYRDPTSSAQATQALLSLPVPPTCILYPDDFSYLGGRNQLEAMGLSVPDDISVAGYDGIYLSQALRPILTTIRQDTERLGSHAARMLIEAIEQSRTHLPRQELIPGELLIGGSVKQL